MDTIFGTEFPLLIKFAVSFAVVIGLIVVAAFLWNRFGLKGRGRFPSQSRQPRLAVVDSAPIDDKRNLVIVRRDNVEHLLLIGGTTDLLVEANISQAAVQPAREPEPLARTPAAVTPSWPPGNANWPAPAVAAAATPKAEPRLEARTDPPVHNEPAILPEAYSRAEPRIQTVPAFEPAAPAPVVVPVDEPVPAAPPVYVQQAQDLDAPRMNGTVTPAADPEPPLRAAASRVPDRPTENPFNEDQNLADMAQRLEAALRRPLAGNALRQATQTARPLTAPARTSGSASVAPAVRITPAEGTPQTAPPVASPVQPPPEENGGYGTLQREMASLLGRKPGSS
jgi:flagellar protein FliO/FliZ